VADGHGTTIKADHNVLVGVTQLALAA